MKSNIKQSRLIYFLLLNFLLTISVFGNTNDKFKNRVNLALRQTAHYLLLEQGDSTNKIEPIQFDEDNGFFLPLKHTFNYDILPTVLRQAFEDYGISDAYEVVVKNCNDGNVYLGFNQLATYQGEVACQGRDNDLTCADIFVQFSNKTPVGNTQKAAFGGLFLLLIAGFTFLVYKKILGRSNTLERLDEYLVLGQYKFDPKNQLLLKGDEKITLTFRENKLLNLFASLPNKVLTRAEILSVVWEDEGVIVGRSLDVFISRLRKLLKQDSSVEIKNVHGVGYRLDLH